LAKATLQEIIDADDRILKDPASFIGVGELGDSSVNFTVRVWVKAADYWGVYFDTNEKVKLTFDEKGISTHKWISILIRYKHKKGSGVSQELANPLAQIKTTISHSL